jgi:uncharacterized protein YbaR (Trm112 family)
MYEGLEIVCPTCKETLLLGLCDEEILIDGSTYENKSITNHFRLTCNNCEAWLVMEIKVEDTIKDTEDN